ncbi:MAG: hypothetical protein HY360_19895 [Verrucomicrobia bacterium]|nr:hypothetical protein [Verrucomicrobiota bacterium]
MKRMRTSFHSLFVLLALGLGLGPLAARAADSASPPPAVVRPNLVTLNPTGPAPKVDGRIEEGEYGTRVAGLMDLQTSDLYAYPAEFLLAGDTKRIYFALRMTLPPGYSPETCGKARDDQALVAAKDALFLMLRPDAHPEEQGYEGAYVGISSNGMLYDAWETINWKQGFCKRDTTLNGNWEVASKINNGVWTIEASVPWEDIRLPAPGEERTYLLSFGVHLKDRRVAWQLHANWFDHYQAFGQLRVAKDPAVARLKLSEQIVQGVVAPAFTLTNGGPTDVPYELLYLVSTPRMVEGAVGTWIFDQQMGAGAKQVLRDHSVYFWNPSGTLKPGETKTESGTGQLETPRYYVLETEARLGGKLVWYQKVPFHFSPPVVAALMPIPSKNLVEARVAFLGARDEDKGALRVEFRQGEKGVLSRDLPITGKEMNIPLSMAPLSPGDYQVVFELKSRQGQSVFTTTTPFRKWEDPAWLKDRAGIQALDPDWVPSSWTPLKVKEGEVTMWGRTHRMQKGSLLAGITSQERPLLAAPVAVKYLRDGKEIRFPLSAPTVRASARGRVELEQSASAPDFDLAVRHRIEFDGMHLMTLRFTPRQKGVVQRLWVEIPLDGAVYSLAMAAEGREGSWWQHGLALDRTFQIPRRYHLIWLGNDDVGCSFFAENYKGWRINSSKPRITLKTEGAVKTLNLLLINEPSEVSATLELQFGMQATPLKPTPPRLREVRAGNGAEPPPYNVLMTHASIWNSTDSKPSPRSWPVLKDLITLAKSRGQQLNPYIGAFFICPWDYIRRDFPLPKDLNASYPSDATIKTKKDATKTDEYFYYQRDWDAVPPRVATTPMETREEVFTTPSGSYTDFFTGGVREILKHEPDFGGFFFDISTPPISLDPDKGHAYLTKDGVQEGTFESLATRDFYKRLYWLFDTHRGPGKKPWFIGHSFAACAPYASFWDMTINGEEIKPDRKFGFSDLVLQKSLEGNPSALPGKSESDKSYDAFGWRSCFGAQFGVENIVLPQYGYLPELNTVAHAREILAFTFLHNTRLRPAYIPVGTVEDFWNKVEIPFGLADTTFHPYWANDVRADPASIKVSYYKKLATDDYLVAVANWSDKETDAAVTLPAGFGSFSSCRNMETGDAIAVPKKWKLKIPAHDLRVFQFAVPAAQR